jgi:hypothetical protein
MWISWLIRLRRLASTGRLLAAVAVAVAGLVLGSVAALMPAPVPLPRDGEAEDPGRGVAAAPWGPLLDLRFTALGRNYLPVLGRAYAAAWLEGARALEAGAPVADALAAVGRSWDAGRTAAFDRWVSPQFDRLVPEGQDDALTAPADKQALARAWRAFARGLDPNAR